MELARTNSIFRIAGFNVSGTACRTITVPLSLEELPAPSEHPGTKVISLPYLPTGIHAAQTPPGVGRLRTLRGGRRSHMI